MKHPKKRSGRAERAESMLAAKTLAEKKADYLSSEVLDALFSPLGRINGKRSQKTVAENLQHLVTAESPEELGSLFAEHIWPRVPPAYRAFVLRRLSELKGVSEKIDGKVARKFGVSIDEYRTFKAEIQPLADRVREWHGMGLPEYIEKMNRLEDQVRQGDAIGGCIEYLQFIHGPDADEALRTIGKQLLAIGAADELPKLNAALETVFEARRRGEIDRETTEHAVLTIGKRAAEIGLAYDLKMRAFAFPEAA